MECAFAILPCEAEGAHVVHAELVPARLAARQKLGYRNPPMKTALVTGAYRGLGFEVARQLSERGFRVILTARRADAGLAAAAKLKNASFLELDITDPVRVARAASQVTQLDVLIKALNSITCQFAVALKDRRIAVNSVCPGWCRTEMGGPTAPRSVEEGAAGIVWLAADAPQDKTALFWRDREMIPW